MRLHATLAATVLALAFVAPVWAKPVTRSPSGKRDPKKLGASALVAWRQTAGKPGRGAATAEEQTAAQIQKTMLALSILEPSRPMTEGRLQPVDDIDGVLRN